MSTREIRVVFTTVPSESVGREIASKLVEEGLVACAQLGQPIRSYYKWENALQEESELTLVLKTSSFLLERAQAFFCQLHPYDIPQWVVLEASGSKSYAEWIASSNGS